MSKQQQQQPVNSPPSSTPLPLKTWLILGLTYATYGLMYCTRKPMSVVKSTMKADSNLNDDIDYPLIETCFFLMYMAGQFSLGFLSSRLSTRMYVLYSIFGSAASCFLFGRAATNMSMVGLWAVNGFSQSAVNTLLVNYLADILPLDRRSSILGIWSSCMQVGGVIANNFAALTVEVTGGWRAAFTYPAIVLGAAGILVALFMPNSKKSKFVADTDKVKTEVMQKMQKKKTTSSFLGTIMAPGVMQLAVSYFCIKFVRYCLMFNLAEYLQWLGYAQTNAAMMASVFDFAGIFGSVASGVIADRFFGGRIITTVAPMSSAVGACLVALVFTGDVSVVACVVTLGLAGFFIAGPDSIIGGPAAKYICDYNGYSADTGKAACGFVNGVASLGTCFQSYATAYVVETFGWNGFSVGLASLAVLATVVSMPIWKLEKDGIVRQKRDQMTNKGD